MSPQTSSDSMFVGTSAVVTGASSGIGRAIAVELARRGCQKLVVHYCGNHQGASETAAMVTEYGCQVLTVPADLGNDDQIAGLVQQSWEFCPHITTWVNNAGVDVLTGDLAGWSFDDKLRRLLEIDVVGTIKLSRQVASQMLEQSSSVIPSITFIGWDQALEGMEGDAGQMFGPVKAAVMSYAKNLAQSLAPGVRVNVVAPGWIKTAWGATTSEKWDRRAKSQSLMQRWGRAEDVAAAVAFVADPQNSFLTSQTIEVNGGWNRRFPNPE